MQPPSKTHRSPCRRSSTSHKGHTFPPCCSPDIRQPDRPLPIPAGSRQPAATVLLVRNGEYATLATSGSPCRHRDICCQRCTCGRSSFRSTHAGSGCFFVAIHGRDAVSSFGPAQATREPEYRSLGARVRSSGDVASMLLSANAIYTCDPGADPGAAVAVRRPAYTVTHHARPRAHQPRRPLSGALTASPSSPSPTRRPSLERSGRCSARSRLAALQAACTSTVVGSVRGRPIRIGARCCVACRHGVGPRTRVVEERGRARVGALRLVGMGSSTLSGSRHRRVTGIRVARCGRLGPRALGRP